MSGKMPECFELSAKANNMPSSNADLLNAWRKKNLDAFKKATQEEDFKPDFLYENDSYLRMLDIVSDEGYADYAQVMIEAGADINQVNPLKSKCPIHFAAEKGHFEVLQVLLKLNADINVRDSFGCTALHCLVKQKWQGEDSPFKKCLNLLLQQEKLELNVPNRRGLTAAHVAVTEGSYEALKMLLEKGSKLDLDSFTVGIKKKTAREEIMQKYPDLNDHLPPPPPPTHEIKMDADKLYSLLMDGHEDRFCEKFKHEIKDKAQKHFLNFSDGKFTFLQYACERGFKKVVETLLEGEADVNFAPSASQRPIHLTCKKGDDEILRLLLNRSDIDLSSNSDGENALHVVARESRSEGHRECLRLLLKKVKMGKLDVNAQDVKGNTPLHYAVKSGDKSSVDQLLENGAYIGTMNLFKEPPLAYMSRSSLENYLDSCITINENSIGETRAMTFDYKFLVPKRTRKQETDEVKVPLTEEEEVHSYEAKQPHPECEPLLYMSRSPELKPLLTHPILTSFTHLKWQRIKFFYWVNFCFYLLFCLLLNIYILGGYRQIAEGRSSPPGTSVDASPPQSNVSFKIAHDKDISEVLSSDGPTLVLTKTGQLVQPPMDDGIDDSPAVMVVRVLLIFFIFLLALREIFQIYVHQKKYLLDLENWLEICLIVVSTFVVIKDCSREFPESERLAVLCPQFCAVAILISWFELVLLVGKHPKQAVHIEMFKTVSINFFKFLAWYVILIIAFALAFFVLFRGCVGDCEKSNPFTHLGISMFKTIVMITGEFEAGEIPFVSFVGTSHLIFIAFVFLIAIVLVNLLNGLAVTDTQTIRDAALLYSSIALVKLISHIEKILLGDATPFKLPLSLLRQLFCCRNSESDKEKSDFLCFEYFARRITFFPDFISSEAIYILTNQNNKIVVVDPNGPKSEADPTEQKPNWISNLSKYNLDSLTTKNAEAILVKRQNEKIKSEDTLDPVSAKIIVCNEKISNLEKRFESLEESTKQNQDLLIQLMQIVSLNSNMGQ